MESGPAWAVQWEVYETERQALIDERVINAHLERATWVAESKERGQERRKENATKNESVVWAESSRPSKMESLVSPSRVALLGTGKPRLMQGFDFTFTAGAMPSAQKKKVDAVRETENPWTMGFEKLHERMDAEVERVKLEDERGCCSPAIPFSGEEGRTDPGLSSSLRGCSAEGVVQGVAAGAALIEGRPGSTGLGSEGQRPQLQQGRGSQDVTVMVGSPVVKTQDDDVAQMVKRDAQGQNEVVLGGGERRTMDHSAEIDRAVKVRATTAGIGEMKDWMKRFSDAINTVLDSLSSDYENGRVSEEYMRARMAQLTVVLPRRTEKLTMWAENWVGRRRRVVLNRLDSNLGRRESEMIMRRALMQFYAAGVLRLRWATKVYEKMKRDEKIERRVSKSPRWPRESVMSKKSGGATRAEQAPSAPRMRAAGRLQKRTEAQIERRLSMSPRWPKEFVMSRAKSGAIGECGRATGAERAPLAPRRRAAEKHEKAREVWLRLRLRRPRDAREVWEHFIKTGGE